jgi:hypothetical protein
MQTPPSSPSPLRQAEKYSSGTGPPLWIQRHWNWRGLSCHWNFSSFHHGSMLRRRGGDRPASCLNAEAIENPCHPPDPPASLLLPLLPSPPWPASKRRSNRRTPGIEVAALRARGRNRRRGGVLLIRPPWPAEERSAGHHLGRPKQALFGERIAPFHSTADKKTGRQRRSDPRRIWAEFTGRLPAAAHHNIKGKSPKLPLNYTEVAPPPPLSTISTGDTGEKGLGAARRELGHRYYSTRWEKRIRSTSVIELLAPTPLWIRTIPSSNPILASTGGLWEFIFAGPKLKLGGKSCVLPACYSFPNTMKRREEACNSAAPNTIYIQFC